MFELISEAEKKDRKLREKVIKLFKNFSTERQKGILNKVDCGVGRLPNELYIELYKIYVNSQRSKYE